MRQDVQAIYKMTPREKQVMLFSATLPKEIRPVCKKFTLNVRYFMREMKRHTFQSRSVTHALSSLMLPSSVCYQQPQEIYVDDESKLTLHGLQQHFINLTEKQKNRKLNDLLDALEFNQVIIFVSSVRRCKELDKLLKECNFPSMAVYGTMPQNERCV